MDDRGGSNRPSVGVTQPDPFAQPQPRFETAQDTDIMAGADKLWFV